ncbi:MAG: hypothetical protein ACRCT5_07190, partial [Tannerellaceae bacterium]
MLKNNKLIYGMLDGIEMMIQAFDCATIPKLISPINRIASAANILKNQPRKRSLLSYFATVCMLEKN